MFLRSSRRWDISFWYCGKAFPLFMVTDWFSQFHLFPRTMMYSGNISMIFSASVCKLLCLCRDMAHDTFSYEYPSYRIFFIRCLVGMLECTSHWYIFYSSYPARLSASSLTLQRAYDNMLNGMHTIPMIRIHTIHILLLMYQWLVHFHNKVYMSVFFAHSSSWCFRFSVSAFPSR